MNQTARQQFIWQVKPYPYFLWKIIIKKPQQTSKWCLLQLWLAFFVLPLFQPYQNGGRLIQLLVATQVHRQHYSKLGPSDPVRSVTHSTIIGDLKPIFLGNKKNISSLLSAFLTQRVVKVKMLNLNTSRQYFYIFPYFSKKTEPADISCEANYLHQMSCSIFLKKNQGSPEKIWKMSLHL